MNLKAWVPAIIAIGVAVAGTFVVFGILETQEAEEREELRRQRRADREAEREQTFEAFRRESSGLVPTAIGGAELGMTQRELREARPLAQLSTVERPSAEEWLEETLSSGAQALYGFNGGRMAMLQVLSRMDPRGVRPHLTAMRETYGRPSGVYRCSAQQAGGIPTLRFVWRKSHLSVQDIFLFYTGGVAVTLYVAPTDLVRGSLAMSQCEPVRSAADLDDLPIATPEMLEGRELQPIMR